MKPRIKPPLAERIIAPTSKEQVIAWLSFRANADSLPAHAKKGLTAIWAEEYTFCECEFCPGHQVLEPIDVPHETSEKLKKRWLRLLLRHLVPRRISASTT